MSRSVRRVTSEPAGSLRSLKYVELDEEPSGRQPELRRTVSTHHSKTHDQSEIIIIHEIFRQRLGIGCRTPRLQGSSPPPTDTDSRLHPFSDDPKAHKYPDPSSKQKTTYDVDEHKLSLEDLRDLLDTEIDLERPAASKGLTTDEAALRLATYGLNKLTPPPGIPEWMKFLKQFLNKFMILLMCAGILCFFSYLLDSSDITTLVLGVFIYLIVCLTCLISYLQERAASNVMASFKDMLPSSCRVVRNGKETKVLTETLVRGDVVLLSAGDKVPADVRILDADDLKVDNSSLTGESDPQPRTVNCTDPSPLETNNLAFYSTLVMNGQGRGVVIRTGEATLIGRIARLAATTRHVETTLQIEIEYFVKVITILAIVTGSLYLAVNISYELITNGTSEWQSVLSTAVVNTIGIIVANVPEGLPATVTVCLTITARRMAARNVFVKKLECVEALGSTTVIASDKTGTLTQNRMIAAHLVYQWKVHKTRADFEGESFNLADPDCAALLQVAACCNRADFDRVLPGNMNLPASDRVVLGDASEAALVRLCESLEPVDAQRQRAQKVFEIPFNSTNKWQLSVHRPSGHKNLLLMMKGAPERIFERCSSILLHGQPREILEEDERRFAEQCERLASNGERVLAFAQLELPASEYPEGYKFDQHALNFPVRNLCFLGLISMMDPPRESVPGAITKCKRAGIKVIMVTGDHPTTARAIARQIGIIWDETAQEIADRTQAQPLTVLTRPDCKAVVVTGLQLDDFDREMWDLVLAKSQIVFARTSPQQKLEIVENLQRRGEIVAVTGDGVNDSPALKEANVGCAMGIVGSDVAKEAADIILMDDSFGSIVAGIEEGRTIFDNLKKSIAYTLTHLVPELAPFMASIVGNIPTMLSPVLIMFIDLVTDVVPAVSLAYEGSEADIMDRPPRDAKHDRLVALPVSLYAYVIGGFTEALGCFASALFVLSYWGYSVTSGVLINWPPTDPDLSSICSPYCADSSYYDEALYESQTAYFMSIVYIQLFNIVCCKARFVSIFRHGMRNSLLNFGLVFSSAVTACIIYVPWLNEILDSRAISDPYTYLVPLPFGLALFIYSEVRKAFVRAYPKSCVAGVIGW